MGVKGFATYLDFLQVDPEEFTRLFNTILINVTSFFRDPANWDVVREIVIPRVAAARLGGDDPGVERRLRLGGRGVLDRDAARGGDRARGVP